MFGGMVMQKITVQQLTGYGIIEPPATFYRMPDIQLFESCVRMFVVSVIVMGFGVMLFR